MKRRSRKYQVGGGILNQGQPNQGGFNQGQPMMNPAMDPMANAQANQMYMNSITNQAQNLVNQGMFKDTRRGNRRAMRAAMRQANPGQGARNFANVMGGFGSVLGSVAPIMQPMIPGQFQRGGSSSPSSIGRAMAKAIERARMIREMDRRDAMREKELLNPQGFNPDGTPKVAPISPNRFEGGLLPPQGKMMKTIRPMEKMGGSIKKSGYAYGGSVCRGLPGGPNEFPM
jgi:hypothetical protein